jgi:ankyrin repeat protein
MKIIELFINNEVNIHENYDEVFVHTCSLGHIDVVKLLVSAGINENEQALFTAISHGHLSVVEFLVSKGANIHLHNEFALRSASHYGHLDVVKYLVEKGTDVHVEYDQALLNALTLQNILRVYKCSECNRLQKMILII